MTRPPNVTVQLPSGVTVDYWDEVGVDGEPQQRRYAYDGEKFVSISTVSNVYDKPALVGWAANVTVEGVLALARDSDEIVEMSVDDIKRALRDSHLDHNSVRDAAAERGKAAHDAFVKLLRDNIVPQLADYPEAWQPYIQAGVRWMLEHTPEVVDCEQIVCSVIHKFAGRYDLHARFSDGRTGRVDFKTTTAWHHGKARKDGSRDLLPPFPEHLSQVEGYELAAVESGFPASDFRAVVRLGPDGAYDMCESWAGPEHFLGDLASYRNRQALLAAGAESRKQAKALKAAA